MKIENTGGSDCAFPAGEETAQGLTKREYAAVKFAAELFGTWDGIPTNESMQLIAKRSVTMANYLFIELNSEQ